MTEEEFKVNGFSSQNLGDPRSIAERKIRKKNKNKKQFLESIRVVDEQDVNGDGHQVGKNSNSGDLKIESGKKKIKKKVLEETAIKKEGSEKSGVEREKEGKKKKNKQLLEEIAEDEDEEDVSRDGSPQVINTAAGSRKTDREEQLIKENEVNVEKQEVSGINFVEEENHKLKGEMIDIHKKKKKEQLLKEATKADRRGICYLSRIPPRMDHVKLRHILSQYGEIQRIYLAPEVNKHRVYRKKADGYQDQEFSEGWVEFTNKSTAKRVARVLNGEQMGGKKRSQFYYDLWNIKYLSKFKWDDLTEEIAYKSAIREQKLALELSAAKRERDFYISKVEKSRALSSIEERLKKKQKVQQETGDQVTLRELAPKVIRQFPQTKPVADKAEERKSQLSKDILAGVFGGL